MKKVTGLILALILMLSIFPAAQASEYMTVYAPDGRTEWIQTADFNAWHAVGWYSAPVMYVYALDGRTELILTADFDAWHKVGWYSAPVMYVYAADGRKQVVTKSDAPAWKAVGWDYQTGYADNIPWENDSQQWAVIFLKCGPYSDWRMNRSYYIDKYFIEMPIQDRLNIKHYDFGGDECFLIIPRYKETHSLVHRTLSSNGLVETGPVTYIADGTPFTINANPSCMWANYLIKVNYKGVKEKYFRVSSEDGSVAGANDLDLTEWKYY